ncbi:MAG: ACS family MFS transporter [Deltaproteobacteria bacterium]|nr:ACS family MFS transporter [Deltaproteobacteria bacterium]
MTVATASEAPRTLQRTLLIALCFAAVFICYVDRVNISLAIGAMAQEFGWDKTTSGWVMSSFFIGYLLTQVPGGWLAGKFGGKWVLAGGVLLWSLFTALTPPAAFAGFSVLIAARIVMGMGEGVTFPAIYALFSRWVPAARRSRAVGLVFSAIPLGTVFTQISTPILVTAHGWPWAFYAFSTLGLLWWAFWHPLTASGPELHPRVSEAELREMRAEAGGTAAPAAPPMGKLLSSTAVWAIVVGHFCNNWGGYVMLSWSPTYFHERLGVDLHDVGYYVMLPSLVSFVCLNLAGQLGDRMIASGMTTQRVRKLMQGVGFGGSAVTLLTLTVVESAPVAVVVMCLSSVLGGAASAGFGSNHLDIAPRHAGALMGLSNTAGTIPGVVGVVLSGWIVDVTGSWSMVFYVAAAVKVFGLVFFLAFAKGEKIFD